MHVFEFSWTFFFILAGHDWCNYVRPRDYKMMHLTWIIITFKNVSASKIIIESYLLGIGFKHYAITLTYKKKEKKERNKIKNDKNKGK